MLQGSKKMIMENAKNRYQAGPTNQFARVPASSSIIFTKFPHTSNKIISHSEPLDHYMSTLPSPMHKLSSRKKKKKKKQEKNRKNIPSRHQDDLN